MTIEQRINIAKASQFLASNYIENAGLFGGGEDILLSRKIYTVRKSVEWLYVLDPTDTSLYSTSVYLYALCKQFLFKASSIIIGGGTIAPVIPDHSDCGSVVIITAANFSGDGKTVVNTDWNGKQFQIFWNNINRFIIQPEWAYVTGGGFTILLPTDFDAGGNNSDAIFIVFVGCLSPGAAIYVPSVGSSFTQTSFDGDGVTTIFNIPHGLSGVPNYVIQPVGADAAGEYTSDVGSTNIIITYNVAPPAGTGNVVFDWSANL